MKGTEDPIAQAQILIDDMRQNYAGTIDAILVEIKARCDALEPVIGHVSRDELWATIRANVLEIFRVRLGVRDDD